MQQCVQPVNLYKYAAADCKCSIDPTYSIPIILTNANYGVSHNERGMHARNESPLNCNKDYEFMNLLHDYQTPSKFISLAASDNQTCLYASNAFAQLQTSTKITKESSKCSNCKDVRVRSFTCSLMSVEFFSTSTCDC